MREFSLQSYDYALPQELIAKYPLERKEDARLLVYDRKSGGITHTHFDALFDFIPRDFTLVFNDTKVIKARIFGEKGSGGKIELLYHKSLPDGALVQIRGRVKVGEHIHFPHGYSAKVCALLDHGMRIVEFLYHGRPIRDLAPLFESIGHIPLPPYLKRADESADEQEYQSVFATHHGAIAAPTASLHFSPRMRDFALQHYPHAFVTLHVGAGTFLGVESEDIRGHEIHSEELWVSAANLSLIEGAKKILCIGTTALRSVEFLSQRDLLRQEGDYVGDCDIFLHCGNPPKKASALLTNFHLPKSSLIMLVASMVGLDTCKNLYAEAIAKKYRFYSYGDGMLIL
ncbi:tRNA preQ1(34) S-adenosylmethionine ribosyltransferase-isomerase QueA [Helicobacter mustelae]|uniref:S-adenosylmethionine:tRNA ribosyltransferase-isomerase n=1 Tax=Helicobacter mustelae (strain ATCC 43772 / CCUG 25715 / CIP 103759 / LMG 18044 / NCTC 12198 / R85-136P) TaxID=679897 RepID=D3UFV3_HELM1|nr:tRNA preQ1(34) S-adenosylmethionine ribosyltransferase-isomerase QueA [Helicobacter mustelae]CBG39374.1 S-adenosylmethionine:tRNA ribosyltransferase-isomerase [Helicobacter mustelae 12198]SQH70887.1 S-adenosylmethionine:tRNA ribosyltransferase-isomerase [Helicobacter mustelae]